jgi:thiosulfate dehydrogenase
MAIRAFLLGAVALAAVEALGIWVFIQTGSIYPGADTPAPWIEIRASGVVTRAIRRESAGLTNPLQPTEANLLAGVKLYGQHCAICHGASDGQESPTARGFYIKAPQFGRHGVTDDPVGETYYKIDHGMRLTPMPAYGGSLTQNQEWQITLFLKNMDKLPPAVQSAWKQIPSQAAPAKP